MKRLAPALSFLLVACGPKTAAVEDGGLPFFDGHYESFPGEVTFPDDSDGIGDPSEPQEGEPPTVDDADDPLAPLSTDAEGPADATTPPEDLDSGSEPVADDAPAPTLLSDDDVAAATDALGSLTRDAYGGVLGSGLATSATGFFHVEHPAGAGRTWLVDPAGNPYFSVGVNTVLRTASVPGIAHYLQRHHGDLAAAARAEWDRLGSGRYGQYGYRFNNVGSFSDSNDLGTGANPIIALAPYTIVLDVDPHGTTYVLADAGGRHTGDAGVFGHPLADPFNPQFALDLSSRFLAKARPTDANLIAYYLGNEIGLFDHPLHAHAGARDLRRWLWSACPSDSTITTPYCAPHALGAFLTTKYGTIAALNTAWGTSHASFDAVLASKPVPGASGCNGACGDDLQRFVRTLQAKWIAVTTASIRAADHHHLVASPRFHISASSGYCFWGTTSCNEHFTDDGAAVPAARGDVKWAPFDLFARSGDAGVDLVAINAYPRADHQGWEHPWLTDGLHAVTAGSGLPVIISEFGVRARVHGWDNSGGAGSFVPRGSASAQAARGDYYEAAIRQLIQFHDVVGVSFHRWADRYTAHDGKMNMGVVHRNGSRWSRFDSAVRHFNAGIYGHIYYATRW